MIRKLVQNDNKITKQLEKKLKIAYKKEKKVSLDYTKGPNVTTVWQNIPSILNSYIHKNHQYVKMASYFIIGYISKKTSKLRVAL